MKIIVYYVKVKIEIMMHLIVLVKLIIMMMELMLIVQVAYIGA